MWQHLKRRWDAQAEVSQEFARSYFSGHWGITDDDFYHRLFSLKPGPLAEVPAVGD
ncbi:MAG TPA: hypothetical protein P5186_14630 [Candidatus Paceibacterota bacterium]|nr:hypothetical protein [Verrucomicrobiota bacterium]HRY49281.1 hypothetical protein [Candidatus Paceibacterota bacterium]HRZ99594.1 hypothetical protein [Candidatus Paceibacterota bacterium]